MSVDSVTSTESTSTATDTSSLYSSATSDLDKDAFLNLLVAQLANQDPLDPMDNQDFIAQMATFSQLEQMTNLNSSFTDFMQGQTLSQYASLVGKEVVATDPDSGEEITGTVEAISFGDDTAKATIDGTDIDISYIEEIKASN